METIIVHGKDRESVITVGEQYKNTKAYLPDEKKVVVIADRRVFNLYTDFFHTCDPIVITAGEKTKTLETVTQIYERLLLREADRSTFLLGVGGGVVCDITGFVASTYLRGVRFGFVPTTLLAQVDAAVGGKNGVNFKGFKNKIGTITQPDFVWCSPLFFRTLPEKEIRSGLAEVVKQALIADASLFEYIESQVKNILLLGESAMERLVLDCLRIKADIVSRDEREYGERRKLNFGHTVGHAVEQITELTHGEAVSVGMAVAAKISVHLGLLSVDEYDRITNLLHRLHLPMSFSTHVGIIIEALKQDKKREGNAVHFVLLDSIGHAVVKAIPFTELREMLLDLFKRNR